MLCSSINVSRVDSSNSSIYKQLDCVSGEHAAAITPPTPPLFVLAACCRDSGGEQHFDDMLQTEYLQASHERYRPASPADMSKAKAAALKLQVHVLPLRSAACVGCAVSPFAAAAAAQSAACPSPVPRARSISSLRLICGIPLILPRSMKFALCRLRSPRHTLATPFWRRVLKVIEFVSVAQVLERRSLLSTTNIWNALQYSACSLPGRTIASATYAAATSR